MAASTTSNITMLQIEYPPSAAQLESGILVPARSLPIQEPPQWVQLWLNWQKLAEDDMTQLYNTIVGHEARNTQAFKQIEAHYDHLYAGIKFLYEAFENDRRTISKGLETEITAVMQSHEDFAREVRQAITQNTIDTMARKRAERPEIQRIESAVKFVQQIGEARGNEENIFRNNLSQWADQKDTDLATLQNQLTQAIEEIKRQKEAMEEQTRRVEELEQEATERQQVDPTPPTPSPIYVSESPESVPARRNKGKGKVIPSLPITYAPAGTTARVPYASRATADTFFEFPGDGQPGPSRTRGGYGATIGALPVQAPPQLLPSAIPLPQTPLGAGGWTPPLPTGNAGGGPPPPPSSSSSSSNNSRPQIPRPPRAPQAPAQAPVPAPQGLVITQAILDALAAGAQPRERNRLRKRTNIKLVQPALYNVERTTKFRPW